MHVKTSIFGFERQHMTLRANAFGKITHGSDVGKNLVKTGEKEESSVVKKRCQPIPCLVAATGFGPETSSAWF
jgi:hypothetical protein